MTAATTFYFDLGSPYAYLAAERLDAVLPGPVRWHPVLLGAIFKATGRRSWAMTPARDAGMREVERRAAACGLPPVAWPQPWPNDGLLAMRAAVAACEHDFGRAFAQAAFRVHFAEGRPLSNRDSLARAAERCGRDGAELLDVAAQPAIKHRLRHLTDAALRAGVIGVPSFGVDVGTRFRAVYWGEDRLGDAASSRGIRRA